MRKMPNVNPVGGTTNPKYNYREGRPSPDLQGVSTRYMKKLLEILGNYRKNRCVPYLKRL